MEDFPVSNVLSKYFDPFVNQASPLMTDYVRTVHYDEKGSEYITYEKFDSASYQKELGPVDNWSLNSLLSAGIDPRFGIHTSNPSRIEGVSSIDKFVQEADLIANDINESKNE